MFLFAKRIKQTLVNKFTATKYKSLNIKGVANHGMVSYTFYIFLLLNYSICISYTKQALNKNKNHKKPQVFTQGHYIYIHIKLNPCTLLRYKTTHVTLIVNSNQAPSRHIGVLT